MTKSEIDEALELFTAESKAAMIRNYFESKTPVEGKYYLSKQGRQMVERMIELKEPLVARIGLEYQN